ncbi:glycosyl hydrolase [Myceligenerans pegani]|uniref:Glycosyl hydrolase n=1 Tax=Myceligenerans pegani TaxID=2776917 RepID=A0ABR9N5V0_9MICO|nr:glycosyl hydrolase [Myceligenerans sp. TRM 65318]MBE1879028.1 glycosyl hydrolase [Myceligenerans sp. TRM 65318]MBE3021299.1 glycosyl hydrolase [Myceligenerans sp. TRM 65318]
MTSIPVPRPLFRDPVLDGAADPVVVRNRAENSWWMLYTNRRAWSPPAGDDDVAWVHGTDLGIASSTDGGATWTHRGVVAGLETEAGRNTFWAPEIYDDGATYHMYVSYITGVPTRWAGHPRTIRHYTSPDLVTWEFRSTLDLGSDRVIDACVLPLPGGGYRMWYKDEADHSSTHAADSDDLAIWRPTGQVVGHVPHEGPNVFELGGWYWMLVDEWAGQRVLRSRDLEHWEPRGRILDAPGSATDDGTIGLHADVVVVDDDAWVFYFTHPGRDPRRTAHDDAYEQRRSSIQVARAHVVDDELRCDRDEVLHAPFLPVAGA